MIVDRKGQKCPGKTWFLSLGLWAIGYPAVFHKEGSQVSLIKKPTPESPLALGDKDTLLDKAIGIHDSVVTWREGTMTYPTIEVFVKTEVKGSPLETFLDVESHQGLM
jgi:hypothetical protein